MRWRHRSLRWFAISSCFAGCSGGPMVDGPPADGTGGGSSDMTGGTTGIEPLEELWCDRLDNWFDVVSTDCELDSSGVTVVARRAYDEDERTDALVVVRLYGLSLGTRSTDYSGSTTWTAVTPEHFSNFVSLEDTDCYHEASSAYTAEGCELELIEIERGLRGSGATSDVEVGSRVLVRVACPTGLHFASSNDVSSGLVAVVPGEFLLEASDCLLGDGPGGAGGEQG